MSRRNRNAGLTRTPTGLGVPRTPSIPRSPSTQELERMLDALERQQSNLDHLSITPAPAAPAPASRSQAATDSTSAAIPRSASTTPPIPDTNLHAIRTLADYLQTLDNPSVPETLAIQRFQQVIRLMSVAEERLFSDEHPFDPDDDKRYRALCREWMRLNSFLQRRVDARARLAARMESERFRNNLMRPDTQHAEKYDFMSTSTRHAPAAEAAPGSADCPQITPTPAEPPHAPAVGSPQDTPAPHPASSPQRPENTELATTHSPLLPPRHTALPTGEILPAPHVPHLHPLPARHDLQPTPITTA